MPPYKPLPAIKTHEYNPYDQNNSSYKNETAINSYNYYNTSNNKLPSLTKTDVDAKSIIKIKSY